MKLNKNKIKSNRQIGTKQKIIDVINHVKE